MPKKRKTRRARRNLVAVAAWQRRSGPMKDRRAPRGGAQNQHRRWLEEAD